MEIYWQNISNADKLLMLYSVQAGCRQLSELSFFSLLPWRVHTPQRQCQKAGLSLSSLSQRHWCPPWMAREGTESALGWQPSPHQFCHLCSAFPQAQSCNPLGKICYGSLAPCGQHVVLPIWPLVWPFFRKKQNIELLSSSSWADKLALGHKPKGACEWRHWCFKF